MKDSFARLALAAALAGLLICLQQSVLAQGTAFTYQGRLNSGGNPANGLYDMQFRLYATNVTGTPIAGPVTSTAIGVTNGLFTTTVDFGAGFTGASNWLEIAVSASGANAFSTLAPRQPLTPVPYAIYSTSAGHSSSASSATTATGVSAGAVTAAGIASGQAVKSLNGLTDGVTLSPGANVTITPSGNTLTIASTAGGGGGGGSNSWSLTGNSGTSPAVGNFVGTLDNQPLELHANGQRVLRLEPGGGLPNVIGGAANNAVTGGAIGATITGGAQNIVSAQYGTVGGGAANTASGPGAFVGGGGYDGNNISGNTALGAAATVAGGVGNDASAAYGMIGGGLNNSSGPLGFVGGGSGNNSGGGYATVGGGEDNSVAGSYATVGGGEGNMASGPGAFVGGGGYDGNNYGGNTASGGAATVSGGLTNNASGAEGTVGGGERNTASGPLATVGGGLANGSSGAGSVVGGGRGNTASGEFSTVAGGEFNTASMSTVGDSTVGGGDENIANGDFATVGGGYENTASGNYYGEATVGGGRSNTASGDNSTVPGGYANTASGEYSTVGGGYGNTASGVVSFAAGNSANATNEGAFVWADSQNAVFSSTANDQFCIRAQGGVQLDPTTSLFFGTTTRQMLNLFSNSVTCYAIGVQNDDIYFRCGADVNGTGFAWYRGGQPNSGPFNNGGGATLMTLTTAGLMVNGVALTSDRNAKENFKPVDNQAVLARVAALPVTEWNYKTDNREVQHIGPMAQDFQAAFGLDGADDKHISVVDEGGVALAAIQGLNQKVDEKDARIQEEATEIQALKLENGSLAERLNELEATVKQLAAKK